MRRYLLALALLITPPAAALAQGDETLADIRQELSVLYVEIQKLNRELSTTGATGSVSGGSSLLDRVNTIESELQRLIAKTEGLELRINSIVSDGTNRIGDLEFRLCELEPGCDISQLKEGTTLGGGAAPTGAGTGTAIGQTTTTGTLPDQTGAGEGVELAMGERDDFKRGEEAFAAGNWAEAAQLLETFRQTYPGGPLSARAGIMKGKALEGTGDQTGAARAYLDVFSAEPDGPDAPEALYNLGRTLGQLGQKDEACVTLGEVGVRFPQAAAVAEAQRTMLDLGCQ